MTNSRPRRASPLLRDGQSATAERAGGLDPLAELARLIGQDEAFGATARNADRSDAHVELSVHRKDPPSLGHARVDTRATPDRDDDPGPPLIGSGTSERTAEDPHDPHEYGEYDGPDYSDGLPNQRRGLRMFVALIGLALAGSGSAVAYWLWSSGVVSFDKASVIAAFTTANKAMPPLEREDRPADERPHSQSDERSVNAVGPAVAGGEKPVDPKPPASAPQALPAIVLYGPAPPQAAGVTSGAAPPSSPADAAPKQPLETAPTPAALEATGPSVAPGYRYFVQLSSQRSEAAAQATSRALQTKFPDEFGGRQPFIRRSDLGDRGVYYRVQVGPFSTIGEANQLCGSLKKSGADCVVQKN